MRIRQKLEDGYNSILPSENCTTRMVEFAILNLQHGQTYQLHLGKRECVGILLSGLATIKALGISWEEIGGRKDVFSQPPTGFYLPRDTKPKLEALTDLSVAIAFAPSESKNDPVLIQPAEVQETKVGVHNWRSIVRTVFGNHYDADHLLAGETLCPPGNWSSSPPYKHDTTNPPDESSLEEVRLFRFHPSTGFALQRIYNDDRSRDTAYVIQNDDVIYIAEGYHPVVTAPGYSLYYLWVLAGKDRHLYSHIDPTHQWLKWSEDIFKEF